VTDRRYEEGGSNSVYSFDGSIRLNKMFQLGWQAIATHSAESDDSVLTSDYNDYLFDGKHTAGFDKESFWGHAAAGSLEFEAKNAYADIFYYEKGKTYRADNGFQPTNNKRYASSMWLYIFRFNNGLVEYISPQLFFGKFWNLDGEPKEEWVDLNLSKKFRLAQMEIHSRYTFRSEKYAGIEFDNIWQWHTCLHSQPYYFLALGGSYNYGHMISYGNEVLGKETLITGWLDLRPLDRIYWESWINFITSKSLENKYDEDSDETIYVGDELFKGYIIRSRINIQLNRELSLRFVTQYNDFYETWDFDPLLTYRINPFTMFYIGSTYDYQKLHGLSEDKRMIASNGEPSIDCTRLCSRQFFMKLQYLFQL
jgi:hypothetical protein